MPTPNSRRLINFRGSNEFAYIQIGRGRKSDPNATHWVACNPSPFTQAMTKAKFMLYQNVTVTNTNKGGLTAGGFAFGIAGAIAGGLPGALAGTLIGAGMGSFDSKISRGVVQVSASPRPASFVKYAKPCIPDNEGDVVAGFVEPTFTEFQQQYLASKFDGKSRYAQNADTLEAE
jgi:hypothetical protein